MSTASAMKSTPVELTLKIVGGPHSGETFTVQRATATLGRGAENDIILPNDPKMSRNHIRISCDHESVIVENLSARNPVLYDNNPVIRIELRPNDRIRIGETEIEFAWKSEGGDKTVKASAETLALLASEKTSFFPDSMEVKDTNLGSKDRDSMPLSVPTGGAPPAPFPNQSAVKSSSNVQSSSKSVDFRNAGLARPSGLPEVRYTPTAGGLDAYSQASPPKSAASSAAQGRRTAPRNASGSRGTLIVIIAAVVIVGGIFIFTDDGKKPKKQNQLKNMDVIKRELGESKEAVDQHMKDKHLFEDGRMDRQYESAQAYYIKGFRDYRQGQYIRAMMSFEAALSFDPNHALARQYRTKALEKQEQIVQFNFDQARRYRIKNNFRLCRSSAQQVMISHRDKNSSQYKDAKKLFDECETLAKGRY